MTNLRFATALGILALAGVAIACFSTPNFLSAGMSGQESELTSDVDRLKQAQRETTIMRRVLLKGLSEKTGFILGDHAKSKKKKPSTSRPSTRPSRGNVFDPAGEGEYANAAGLLAGGFGGSRRLFSSENNSPVIPGFGSVISLRMRVPRVEVNNPENVQDDLWHEASSELDRTAFGVTRRAKPTAFDQGVIERATQELIDCLMRHVKHLKSFEAGEKLVVAIELRSLRNGFRVGDHNTLVIQTDVSAMKAVLGSKRAVDQLRRSGALRIDRF